MRHISARFIRRVGPGFTIIEVIVVIALLTMISTMAAPYLNTTISSNSLVVAAEGASDALRAAQSSGMSRKNTGKFGVHFDAAKYVFFEGATYAPADVNNEVHALTGFVTVTSVTLSPGGACAVALGTGNCDVHFINHRGAPTESGSIVFTDSGGATKTVTINAVGMVDIN